MADETPEATEADADAETPEPEIEIERRYGVPLTHSRGQAVVHPSRDEYIATIEAIRADEFNVCIDVTAVDYLEDPARDLPHGTVGERFEVVASFLSHTKRERIRVRVQVPADDPTIATLFDLYPGSEALEREVHDMFGIAFENHPDLSRILMPETWEGHPLRKDYAVGRIPVQFKGAPGPR